MRRLLTLISLVLAPMWASASDMPRVVSVNVCTDQLIMLLADPAQVVSLSQLSDDPRASVMAEEAKRFAKNNGRAEVIAVQNPDIVVAGEYNDPALIALLRSIGIEVVQFPVTRSLDDIPQELRKMGAVLGRHSKAETLATALERDLENRPVVTDTAPLAAFFLPNGYALGAGTLSHDILVAGTGVRGLSGDRGRTTGFSESGLIALSQFPVLNTTVEWVCGTPFVMNAVAQVAERVGRLR